MDYTKIMQKITSGMTGDSEKDIEYLKEQGEKYASHQLATEILRGIFRLIYQLLPDEKKGDLQRIFKNKEYHTGTVLLEIEKKIQDNKIQEAEKLIKNILPPDELFNEDEVSIYLEFENDLESLFYLNKYKPVKEMRRPGFLYNNPYHLYAYILVEKKEYDKALDVIELALKRNPLFTTLLFEKAEIYKMQGDMDEFFIATLDCFTTCYKSEDIARYFRNIGYYLIEREEWSDAAFCYFCSISWHSTDKAQSQMHYISQMTGRVYKVEDFTDYEKILAKYSIPTQVDPLWALCAHSLGDDAKESREYEQALDYYAIAYELAESDETLQAIEECKKHLN